MGDDSGCGFLAGVFGLGIAVGGALGWATFALDVEATWARAWCLSYGTEHYEFVGDHSGPDTIVCLYPAEQ